MFEDSFIGLLRQYPEAVSDRKRFIALMKDFFPEQPMQVNLINTAFDLGIVEELNKTANIGNAFAFRPMKPLDVSRTTHDAAEMNRVYQQGREEALQRLDELKKFLANEQAPTPTPSTDEQP